MTMIEKRFSDQAGEQLNGIAALLDRPRDLLVEIAKATTWTPLPGSKAEEDLAFTGLQGDHVTEVVNRPRSLAVLYSRVGSDHLAGMAALLRAREVWYPFGALARAAVENGARTVRVLDPRTDVRGRCARAWLEELASAHFYHEAVAHLTDKKGEGYDLARERRRLVKEIASTTFADVQLQDDPFKWSLDSHRYLRITDVVDEWTGWRDDDLPGRGVYDALSLYPHPQGFAAREEVEFSKMEPSESRIVSDIAHVARMASAAFATWYDGFTLTISYHGFDETELDALAADADALYSLGERRPENSERESR